MIKYNLKKRILTKKEIIRLLNFFNKINPKLIRNYGSNRYSLKKNQKQMRQAIMIFGSKMNKSSLKELSEINDILDKLKKIIIKLTKTFSTEIDNRIKNCKNPKFEIFGNIVKANKNYKLDPHTDHPSFLISAIIPITDLESSSTCFYEPINDSDLLFKKNFQPIKKFRLHKKFNLKEGDILSWLVDKNSWHGVMGKVRKDRLTINLHYKLHTDYIKNNFEYETIKYPLDKNSALVKSFLYLNE
jgi:hypothetical protein